MVHKSSVKSFKDSSSITVHQKYALSLSGLIGCSIAKLCDQILNSYSAFSPYPEEVVSIVSTSHIDIRLIIIPKGGTMDQRQKCTV